MPIIPILGAGVVLALRTWTHAHQPHRLGERADLRLDREYGRGALVFKHVASFAFLAAMFGFWLRSPHDSLLPREIVAITLALAGVVVRQWAMFTLGRFFTFELGLRGGHALVTTGPYRFVMHPAYTGSLLVEFGVCLFFGVYAIALPLLVATGSFLSRRIRDEDDVLLRAFGREFEHYAATRARLVPWVY